MTSYIMKDILTPVMFWKIWRREASNFIFGRRGARMALIRLCENLSL